MKFSTITVVLCFSLMALPLKSQKNVIHISYATKVDSLLKLMTVEEKIGQLNLFTSDWDVTGPSIRKDYLDLIKLGKVGAIFNAYTVDYITKVQKIAVEQSRLHIPLLFGYDVIHGHRTIFPIPLAQAASWDLQSIQQSDRIAATEATAEGLNWTFSPMVDITRDARWGRVMEGAGEDTWLGCRIAETRVKAFQGDDLSRNNTMLACVKHFAAYGAPTAGRDYNTVDMSDRSLFEWYLPTYKACIDAGVGSVMASFNEIGGVPSTSNKWLMTDLLRNQWHFKGFVVTDYDGVNELVAHGVAADSAQAGQLAINAGIDMDMQTSIYMTYMAKLIHDRHVDMKTLDDAVRRILEAKYKLGLFDDPYRYCSKKREKEEIMRPEYLEFARHFVAKSCVLLKNNNQTLPFHKNVKSVAVIGPLGNSKEDMLGSWSAAGQWDKCVTLYEGVKLKLPGVKVQYVKGCNISDNDEGLIAEAVALAQQSDIVILAIGEGRDLSGEASSRTNISLPGIQQKLADAIFKTGKPTAVVLFNGRPLTIPELDNTAPAILETWFGGTQSGNGIADVLFGDYNPAGKLTMTFPRHVGQVPLYYNEKNTGRPINPKQPDYKFTSRYIDSPNTPLYPFGYGLSYTTFSYSPIHLDKTTITASDSLMASIVVKNTGNYDGEEVVQLYVRDLVGEVTRPVKELKGFKKITLKKGASATVTFTIHPDDLSYVHQNMNYTWDPGDFEIFIGTNSVDNQKARFLIR